MRSGIDGNLDPSLTESVTVPLDIGSDFEMEHAWELPNLVMLAEGVALSRDDLHVGKLPSLPGHFDDMPFQLC
ncbi:unnamed protein product [Chondrus crispus]|uniref:Uncharacterized protein n=1 Tax=Chondrus crispus TaxID=2769 RepID=R7QDS3_CHOCR|nr:unnamed protein product [Chondrus crispus]CDF36239.1 unnamed protein product [Chondrus crispus]|eukprot:XP_005716058.1 unnamed protein product [Chondrus crispus]